MQFDLYRLSRPPAALIVDIQSRLLDHLTTRVVIPLVQRDQAPKTLIKTLNPSFTIGGQEFVLMPQIMASISVSELTHSVGIYIHV